MSKVLKSIGSRIVSLSQDLSPGGVRECFGQTCLVCQSTTVGNCCRGVPCLDVPFPLPHSSKRKILSIIGNTTLMDVNHLMWKKPQGPLGRELESTPNPPHHSGGSRGCHQCMPPYGSRFFHFDIQIFWNVATSGVGAPPMRSAPPYGKSWICYCISNPQTLYWPPPPPAFYFQFCHHWQRSLSDHLRGQGSHTYPKTGLRSQQKYL